MTICCYTSSRATEQHALYSILYHGVCLSWPRPCLFFYHLLLFKLFDWLGFALEIYCQALAFTQPTSIGMVHERMFSYKFVLLESKKKKKCSQGCWKTITIVRWAISFPLHLPNRLGAVYVLCWTVKFHFLLLFRYVFALVFSVLVVVILKNDRYTWPLNRQSKTTHWTILQARIDSCYIRSYSLLIVKKFNHSTFHSTKYMYKICVSVL